MAQVWVEQQQIFPQAYDDVLDALPQLGLRVLRIGLEQGTVTAVMPADPVGRKWQVSVFRLETDQTCVTVRCPVPLPPSAKSVSRLRKSAHQILSLLEQALSPVSSCRASTDIPSSQLAYRHQGFGEQK